MAARLNEVRELFAFESVDLVLMFLLVELDTRGERAIAERGQWWPRGAREVAEKRTWFPDREVGGEESDEKRTWFPDDAKLDGN
jgi:hypothetical protein